MPRRAIPDLPPRPDLSLESGLWSAGLARVAGLDEAGRGAWAGPVFAAAVILPCDLEVSRRLDGVRDSKQMNARQRAFWAGEIKATALAWGIGQASQEEIDAVGIAPATRLAMLRALLACGTGADHLLLDAFLLPEVTLAQTALLKGDARSLSIAAASVLAKTARDDLMTLLDASYPGYGFAAHKGYGTTRHRAALERLGPCLAHRMSFAPLKTLV